MTEEVVFTAHSDYIIQRVMQNSRGRGVMGARGGRIAEMRVRFPSSPFIAYIVVRNEAFTRSLIHPRVFLSCCPPLLVCTSKLRGRRRGRRKTGAGDGSADLTKTQNFPFGSMAYSLELCLKNIFAFEMESIYNGRLCGF
jgi:hypothetical protein